MKSQSDGEINRDILVMRASTPCKGQHRDPADLTWPLTPPHLYLWGDGTASAAAALTVAALNIPRQIVQ